MSARQLRFYFGDQITTSGRASCAIAGKSERWRLKTAGPCRKERCQYRHAARIGDFFPLAGQKQRKSLYNWGAVAKAKQKRKSSRRSRGGRKKKGVMSGMRGGFQQLVGSKAAPKKSGWLGNILLLAVAGIVVYLLLKR